MDEVEKLRAELEAELELIVMDVVAGGPNTSMLHKSIRRVIEARLRRHIGSTLKGYNVEVGSDRSGEGVEVVVVLETRQRARTIRLRAARSMR
jgi:hypothetical protein